MAPSAETIRIVAFYFGQLPPYFPLTLRSMASNGDISWVLISDSDLGRLPENVSSIQTSFESFRDDLQEHYTFPISVPRPYKIADFRPAFGEILSNLLAGFDFWGCCDLDVIFGNIRQFLSRDVLRDHDKILLRGAFSLFRNTPDVNSLYKRQGCGVDYQDVFQDPHIRYFDEWEGIFKIITGLGVSYWDGSAYTFDINNHHYIPRANYSMTHRPRFLWKEGRLIERGSGGSEREGLYIHLQKRSMRKPGKMVLDSPEYYIGANGFTDNNSPGLRLISGGAGFARFHLRRGRARFRPGDRQ